MPVRLHARRACFRREERERSKEIAAAIGVEIVKRSFVCTSSFKLRLQSLRFSWVRCVRFSSRLWVRSHSREGICVFVLKRRSFSFRRVEEDMAAARRGALHILRRPSGFISLTRGSGMAATVRAVATSSPLPSSSSSSSSPPASSSDSGILLLRGLSASNRTPSWHSSRFFAAEAGPYINPIPLACKAEGEEEEEYENDDDDDDLLLLFSRKLSSSSSSLVLKEKEKEIMKKRSACMRRCLSLCVYGCWICLLGDCSTICWSCGGQLLLAVWHLAKGGKRYFLTYTPLHGGCCRGLLVCCATICESTLMMMDGFCSHSSTKNMIWFLDQWRRNSVSAILGFWSGAVKWFPLLMFSGTSIFFFFFFFFILFFTARCVRCKVFDTHRSFDGQPKSIVQRFRACNNQPWI